MLLLSFYVTAMLAIAGVVIDRIFGEPATRHPLVAFGRLATRIEAKMNTGFRARPAGILAWLLAVVPPVAVSWILVSVLPFAAACAVHVALLWFSLGAKSLRDHIAPIARALGQERVCRTAGCRQRLARHLRGDGAYWRCRICRARGAAS